MNYKILVGILGFPWAIAAFLTGVMYMSTDIAASPSGDSAAVAAYLHDAANPSEVRVSSPAVGATDNPIGADVTYPTTASSWLRNIAHSVTLTGPIWQPWTAPIRYIIYVFVSPALLMLTIGLAQAFSFFISSIFGRVTP